MRWKARALECTAVAFISKDSLSYLGPCPEVHFHDTGREGHFCPPSRSLLVSQQCVFTD